MAQPNPDPWDSLLSLEEEFYTEGHTLGLADGARAGKIEGRRFGLQNGFEKYVEMGRLGGRAAVWKARTELPATNDTSVGRLELSERMQKHLRRLCELTDARSLATENEEEAVEEFEGRLRDARAKVAVIKAFRAVEEGEGGEIGARRGRVRVAGGGEMEDFAGSVPIVRARESGWVRMMDWMCDS